MPYANHEMCANQRYVKYEPTFAGAAPSGEYEVYSSVLPSSNIDVKALDGWQRDRILVDSPISFLLLCAACYCEKFSNSVFVIIIFQSLGRLVGRSVCRSVCRSVGLSVCRSVGLSDCRSVGLSVCRSVGMSVCRSVGLSVCRSVGLSV